MNCPDGVNYQGPGPCVRDPKTGLCGYTWKTCPDPNTNNSQCTYQECGPAPLAPLRLCPDGKNYEGPGPCQRRSDGTCGYTWLTCPTSGGTGTGCASPINSGPTGSSYYQDCNICVCGSDGVYRCSFSDCKNGSCPCPSTSNANYKTTDCSTGNYISGVLLCSLVNGVCTPHVAQCPVIFTFTVQSKDSTTIDLNNIKTITSTTLGVPTNAVTITQVSNSNGQVTFQVQLAENSVDQSSTSQQSDLSKLSSGYSQQYLVKDSLIGSGSSSTSGVVELVVSSVFLIGALLF